MKAALFSLGRPFSPLYSAAMRCRELAYARGLLRRHRLDAMVISVGNLVLGGSGKTPVVRYLAQLLNRAGLQPAIISRGYGGAARQRVNVVSDGATVFLSAAEAGDEPALLAESLPGIPVLTGIVRRLPAQQAIAMGARVLLLDDGFQHLALHRDLDLVLFNADALAGNSRVFPGGDLREPISALKRASAFILSSVHAGNQQRAQQFAALLREHFPGPPVFYAGYEVERFIRLDKAGELHEQKENPLAAKRCFAFCGIAQPSAFFHTLERAGYKPAGQAALSDHQAYTPAVVRQLMHKAQACNADALLTTEKDLVKVRCYADSWPLPLWGLGMGVSFAASFDQFIIEQVATRLAART